MSRSNPNQSSLTNPCQKWFKWKGNSGTLTYYDKERKEDIEVLMPFTFIYLDQLHTIKGFSEADGEGIYANEIKEIKTSPISVRVGKREVFKGLYSEIKERSVSLGGKYCQSVYIAYKDETGNLVLGNISFMGSSLSGGEHKIGKGKEAKIENIQGWLEFSKGKTKDLESKAVVITKEDRVCTKGATAFYAPKFKLVEVGAETNEKATELDRQLQEYLAQYLMAKPQAEAPVEPTKFEQAETLYAPTAISPEPKMEDDFGDLPF
jgi:hypothetical protein